MLLFRKWPYLITHTWFNMNILPFMHPSEIIRFKTSGKHKTYYHHAENNEQIYFLHSDQTLLDQSSGEGNRTSPPRVQPVICQSEDRIQCNNFKADIN